MPTIRVRMDATERTDWTGVSAVVDVPDDVNVSDAEALAAWLLDNHDAWADALSGASGMVHPASVDIHDVRLLG